MRSVVRPFTAKCASIIARSVRRHRPQSPPAPHASAICFDVQTPLATASLTAWLVTPMHRQTNIAAPSTRLFDSHEMGELADELGRIGAETGVAHPLRGGVGMLDPLPGADLVLDLLEDHHFVTVVEGAVDPDLAHAAALKRSRPSCTLTISADTSPTEDITPTTTWPTCSSDDGPYRSIFST